MPASVAPVAATRRLARLRQLLGWAVQARREGGPALARQLLEIMLLRLPPGSLGFSEYYDYRLFEPRYRWAEKRRFVGWRGEPALDRANAGEWQRYADDKIALAALLGAAGIAHPRLRATYLARGAERPDGAAALGDAAALAAWLRANERWPLFAKPAHAGFGRGAFLVEGRSAADELLLGGPGPDRMAIDAFVAALANPGGRGYLLQDCLAPPAALAALLCGRLSSLRMMTLTPRPGAAPELYRAIWKLPRRHNIIDNFESGSTGNLLAQIDLATGRVLRVIGGYGMSLRELDRHPDSNEPCVGLQLPDWPAVVATTLAAAALLPGLRFQHWDVALADGGPVPLEVNLFAAGGTELSQLVERRGLLEPRLLAAILPR